MDFVEPIFRKMYTLEIGYQRTQYKRGEIFPRNFFMDITIEDFQAGRSYFKLRVVIEENIITIRKRIKGRFLTNSPVIATAANSLRPVGAHLKMYDFHPASLHTKLSYLHNSKQCHHPAATRSLLLY